MTSSWLSRDLATICWSYTKWEPDLVSQVLHAPLPSNFDRYVRVTKGFHQNRHRICQVTLALFSIQVQNEDQRWYLRFHMNHGKEDKERRRQKGNLNKMKTNVRTVQK